MKIQIPHFKAARVLVVGDVMLDRYWHGATSRISPEAPVPVVHIQQCEDKPGGAGNVALNITALGAKAILLGISGNDVLAHTLENKLTAAGVECHLHKLNDRPTITKLRVLSQHQQLIRLDNEEGFHGIDDKLVFEKFKQLLPTVDVVVLSDYAKGTLNCAALLIDEAQRVGKPVLVDPKGNDFTRYTNATLITPNRKEFEAIMGHCENEEILVSKGLEFLHRYKINALLITRGEQGMTLLRTDEPPLHLLARQREVYDVTGAGDTVIATISACLAAHADLPTAITLSNLAAGIVVSKLGAASVTVPELRRILLEDHATLSCGVMTEDQLLMLIEDARAHGETIVLTNGCFDILHAGHVAYLAQAKLLGDRLIVAVNDDDSVKRLKGAERPFNSLSDRMAVLAGLASVDWVVPFSENTPERIVEAINPDIFVKGGDYRIEDLPESKHVLAQGNQVKILKFVEGRSTSKLIARVKELA